MGNIVTLDSIDREELDVYARLTEAQIRNRLEPEKGIFIAESPKVIRLALDAGYEPVSFLMEQKHIEGDAKDRTPGPPPICPERSVTRPASRSKRAARFRSPCPQTGSGF